MAGTVETAVGVPTGTNEGTAVGVVVVTELDEPEIGVAVTLGSFGLVALLPTCGVAFVDAPGACVAVIEGVGNVTAGIEGVAAVAELLGTGVGLAGVVEEASEAPG